MITREKVDEYTWCDGDIDGYSRSGRWKKDIISDEEWRFIDQMVMEIGLIRKNLVADSFREAHEIKKNNFDSLDTYEMLRRYEEES